MTAAVASPTINVPDMGAAGMGAGGAKAAQTPEPGESFGAMLSGLDAVADTSAPDAGKSSDTQIDDVAFADAAALAAAMSNQMSWMAQLDAAKSLPPKQDTTKPPATAPAAPPPQALPEFADALSPKEAQAPTPPVPRANDGPQSAPVVGPVAAPVAESQAGKPMQVALLNAPADEPAPETGAEPVSVTKLAAAPTQLKDEKPAHPAADASLQAQAQSDVPAPSELSSPLATQVLGAPPAPAPQTTPAPATASNPAPEPDQILSAGLVSPTQTPPRPRSSDKTEPDKTSSEKNAAAPDAKANANAPTSVTRPLHSSASADPSPAPAAANDPSDRPVKTAEPPLEHTAKNETAPLATNLPQTNPAPSSTPAPLHATSDLSAAAISNAPPAPSLDMSTPVRLSFTTPLIAEAPSFDALALRIASRSANGENNFAIRLDPPELGRIEVNLNVNSDGHAQANLSADKPQTLDLLQKDASALERALKDAGINLAGGMTFSLKGEGRSGAWRDMQNGARGRNIQIAAADAANANAAITTSAALAARAYGLPIAVLDIRV